MAVDGATPPPAFGRSAERPAGLITNGIASTAKAETFKPERFGSLR